MKQALESLLALEVFKFQMADFFLDYNSPAADKYFATFMDSVVPIRICALLGITTHLQPVFAPEQYIFFNQNFQATIHQRSNIHEEEDTSGIRYTSAVLSSITNSNRKAFPVFTIKRVRLPQRRHKFTVYLHQEGLHGFSSYDREVPILTFIVKCETPL